MIFESYMQPLKPRACGDHLERVWRPDEASRPPPRFGMRTISSRILLECLHMRVYKKKGYSHGVLLVLKRKIRETLEKSRLSKKRKL